MHTCPWCGTGYLDFRPTCQSCGGALPTAPGSAPADPPPPPPRALPPGFRRRTLYTKNVYTMIGIIFTPIGGLFTAIFTAVAIGTGEWMILLGGAIGSIFLIAGILMLRHGLRRGHGILRAFEHGLVASGRVTRVYHDTSIKINGRSPWAVEYAFAPRSGESDRTGTAHGWDDAVGQMQPAQRVHVLYVESDPSQSTLYPPLS